LVRRQDAAWGRTSAEAKQAAWDTFHFTNCVPQHRVFNQSGLASHKGLKLWGNLENYLTRFARSDKKRLCIFNGPIFRSADRQYRGLRIPREYWKIVIFDKGGGQPTAVAFLLSQQNLIADLAEKDLDVGQFKVYQISLTHLERLTKLDFNLVRRGDALSRRSLQTKSIQPGVEASLVTSLAQVVV
jgi:endonuclease G